ncbi:MAG: prepilin peptidase [Parcubacteria group bacterium]|nr:prepilin peptidase [Parcubacteria group bacterium]
MIAAYDLRHKIIPDSFVYFFAALGLFFALSKIFIGGGYSFLLTGPALALPLSAVWFFSKGKWIGLGDAKLALGMGWLLGPSGGISALILSFWIGAVVSLLFLAVGKILPQLSRLFPRLKRLTMKSEIPFAPFLILGTFLVFFYDISFTDIQSLFQ